MHTHRFIITCWDVAFILLWMCVSAFVCSLFHFILFTFTWIFRVFVCMCARVQINKITKCDFACQLMSAFLCRFVFVSFHFIHFFLFSWMRVRVQTLVVNAKRASITRRILRLNENIYILLGSLIHSFTRMACKKERERNGMNEYDWNSEHTEVAVNLVSFTLLLSVCRSITDFLITLTLCRVYTTMYSHTNTQQARENIVI